jgi:protein TonB
MVVSQSNGFAAPIGSEDYIKRPGLSRLLLVAIGVSVSVHVALVAFLAYQKFSQPIVVEPTGKIIDTTTWREPPKATPTKKQPPPTIKPHVTDAPPIDVKTGPIPKTDQPTAKNQTDEPPVISTGPTDTTVTPPAIVGPPVIRQPTWLRQPGPREFSKYYPEEAMRLGLSGSVSLRCTVAASGSVGGCVVTSETPAGKGFGKAAQKLSRYFQMSPRTVDDRPVDGAQVTIPIKFSLE